MTRENYELFIPNATLLVMPKIPISGMKASQNSDLSHLCASVSRD
jgi:hypothetical protein